MESALKELAATAIRRVLMDELSDHSTHGWGEYKMSDEAKDLIRRARELGVGPLEPYDGYSYMPAAG